MVLLYKNVIVLHVFDSTSGFVHLLSGGHISNNCVIFHRNIIYSTRLPVDRQTGCSQDFASGNSGKNILEHVSLHFCFFLSPLS